MMKLFQSTQNTRPILPDSLRFIRSDVPKSVTAIEEQWLLTQNIRTIIDLREPWERSRKPCPLGERDGFAYLCLPVTGGGAIPPTPADVAASYIRMADEQMERIIGAAMNASSNVLYFCNAGKDRTGVVSAILLRRLGFNREFIIADYLKSAENLKETLETFARNHPDVDLNVITPQRAYMEGFLNWLDQNKSQQLV